MCGQSVYADEAFGEGKAFEKIKNYARPLTRSGFKSCGSPWKKQKSVI